VAEAITFGFGTIRASRFAFLGLTPYELGSYNWKFIAQRQNGVSARTGAVKCLSNDEEFVLRCARYGESAEDMALIQEGYFCEKSTTATPNRPLETSIKLVVVVILMVFVLVAIAA
jgi:hypothetical protein